MRAQRRRQRLLLAAALCLLLACTVCRAQDAAADAHAAAAREAAPAEKAAPAQPAGGAPAKGKMTPVARPKGKAQPKGGATAITGAAKPGAAAGKFVGKAPAKGAANGGAAAGNGLKLRQGLMGKDLEAAVQKALEAAMQHKPVGDILSQYIEEAPAVSLHAGIDDVSPTGACQKEAGMFCLGVEPGEHRLANCLRHQLDQEALPDFTGANKWSDGCRTELDQFRIDESTDINKNLPLAKACQKDIKRRCKNVTGGHGQFVACLRSQPERLTQKCYDEIFQVEQAAADDIRTDPLLWAACQADAGKHCKSVKPEKGKVQQCLRRHRNALDWGCREQLFRQAMENADDIRKSSQMFQLCLNDKKKFCAEVPPGHSRAMDCLEAHRMEPDFSEPCRNIIEASVAERSADFRLDASLRAACKKDIQRRCAVDQDIVLDPVQSEEGLVINCLQDYRDELRAPACKAAVHRVMQRGAEDIRFNVRLGDACAEDRSNLCSDVPPGSARVIRCLQSKRKQLSRDCRAAMFDEETLMGESIDFQFPMKVACAKELGRWCADVPHDHARAIRCLQDHQDAPGFGQQCRDEMVAHESHAAEDYRLNARLAGACDSSMKELCADVHCEEHAICGGAMLRCLADKAEYIVVADCQHEVRYYQKMGVANFRTDAILADACRSDVDKFCSKTPAGYGRVHKCLRTHMDELTASCRAEQQRLFRAAADSFSLQPALAADCAAEREEHCADVRPGSSRIYNCLLASADKIDFGKRCRNNLAGQQLTRLRDWQMDHNLRTACKGDVPTFCGSAVAPQNLQGQVLRCLVDHVGVTSTECTRETARAVFTGLQFYAPGLPVINVCDKDAERFCISDVERKTKEWAAGKRPGKGKYGILGFEAAGARVGQIRTCLQQHVPMQTDPVLVDGTAGSVQETVTESETAAAESAGGRRRLRQGDAGTNATEPQQVAEPLSDECAALVVLGDGSVWEDFEAALSTGRLATQLTRLQSALHLPDYTFTQVRITDGGDSLEKALTLTGWGAVAGMFALAAVVLGAVALGWKRYYDSRYGGYEVVMKKPPRRERAVEMQ